MSNLHPDMMRIQLLVPSQTAPNILDDTYSNNTYVRSALSSDLALWLSRRKANRILPLRLAVSASRDHDCTD